MDGHTAMECDACMPSTRDSQMADRTGVLFDENISARIRELAHQDSGINARAAQFLFERAHTSHPRSADNKVQIGMEGAIGPLCSLVMSPLEDTRFQACSALSELAFCNEENCRAIIGTPGCLRNIIHLLQPENGNTQCDAALIINNCAAFCSETCVPIVNAGVVTALQRLALEGTPSAKNVAVGALNSLSRCFSVRTQMLQVGVVENTLTKVLCESGSGEQYEARLARAAMAVANLTGHKLSILSVGSNFHTALSSICKIMRFAIEERSWAGIFFAPYSVCLPLYNLSLNPDNRKQLVEFGMIQLVADLLRSWKKAHLADETLMLALSIAEQIALRPDDESQRLQAKQSGLVQAIKTVELGLRGEPSACRDMASAVLESLRQRHRAIWMCQHGRVGGQSPLHLLDDSITDMIVGFASV